MTFKENMAYLKYFGLKLTFWKSLSKAVCNLSKGRFAWYIHNKNHEAIDKYLCNICSDSIEKLKKGNYEIQPKSHLENNETNHIIWTMWWQGEEEAPKIIKLCLDSMRKNASGCRLIVIDKNNIHEFVKLPQFIMDKLETTKKNNPLSEYSLGITHFSDIVRCSLLYQYGGIWMDASIFLSGKLNHKFFSKDWTTLTEENEWYVGKGLWTVFFMGAKRGNKLMEYLYDMLIEYWRKKDVYVNYLMIYNMMNIAYQNNSYFYKMMNESHVGEERVITLNKHYSHKANTNEIEHFLLHQHIHKLSWKWWGKYKDAPVHIFTENNELTWFGYLYKKYMEN